MRLSFFTILKLISQQFRSTHWNIEKSCSVSSPPANSCRFLESYLIRIFKRFILLNVSCCILLYTHTFVPLSRSLHLFRVLTLDANIADQATLHECSNCCSLERREELLLFNQLLIELKNWTFYAKWTYSPYMAAYDQSREIEKILPHRKETESFTSRYICALKLFPP